MAAPTESKYNVQYWVEQSFKDKQFARINVDISTSPNDDGYMGDIVFVNVSAESKVGKKEEYHLVLKFSNKNDHLRSILPVTEVYKQEIYMYEVLFPFYKTFHEEKRCELDFVPKCYKTFNEYGSELVVLENLKHLGFKLCNKYSPMNFEHIKIVLEIYGRWHAYSFSIKEQKREAYDRITFPLIDTMARYTEIYITSLKHGIVKLREALEENNEHELLRKFNKVMESGDSELYVDMLNKRPSKTIVSHGDCWNNNFMFKYGSCMTSPEKVAIIDWQMSFSRSPVFDLSYFLYSVASKQEFDQVDKLLDIYYKSLADNIRKLGSDPEKLFTREELLNHWRDYSSFGFIMSIMVTPYVICDPEDAPSFGDITADDSFGTIVTNVEVKNKDRYYKRIRDIVDYYVSFHDIL